VKKAAAGRSWLGVVLVLLLKVLAIGVMIALPLLGVWVASSLAALRHGPVWLTLLAGLLLCPVAPLVWELWSAWRRARGASKTTRILSFSDRLILRTLALNVVFLTALLAAKPSAAFTALSARGDWMLDGRRDASASAMRTRLFAAAAKLEWLYLAARDNPFRKPAPTPDPVPAESAHPIPTSTPRPSAGPAPTSIPTSTPTSTTATPTPVPPPTEQPTPPTAPEVPSWPAAAELDPLVVNMPPGSEATIQSVASYIRERAPAPFARLKAVHDWVADRVAYDAESYLAHRYGPQDAESVFSSRLSVCAGYANLMQAMGRAAGLEVVYLSGDARTQGNDLSGQGHAWNAARIDGKWYLLDATWDSGYLGGSRFRKRYSTEYFLTPPRIFNLDHLPDDAKWQLLEKPLSRGEFLRQPALAPLFFARGLELLSPDRSQVDVQGKLEIQLLNPQNVFLLASYETRDEPGERTRCRVGGGVTLHVSCEFARPGRYDVKLFSNREQNGSYDFVGQLQANAN
jgi:transglutaminase-like putative cysteine protease